MASREIRRRSGQSRQESRQVARHKQAPKPRSKQATITYGIIALMIVLAAAIIFWPPDLGQPTVVRFETDKGDFTMHVYPKMMPKTVENFVKLVEEGFYDELTFHRVEDWVVQGGDPDADGTGGPGWTIDLETNRRLKHVRGRVGMAREQYDINSAGSQFYIVKTDAHFLDDDYACFGEIASGMDVVEQLEEGDTMLSVTIVSAP